MSPSKYPRHDKVDEAIAMLETLESEHEDDYDLALPPDSDDDNAVVNAGKTAAKKKKKKKKKTRKVISIESFLNMSDDGVLEATTFDHYYGEDDGDFVRWEILKDGEEIAVDAMEHKHEDESPFSIDILWTPEPAATDYLQFSFSTSFHHCRERPPSSTSIYQTLNALDTKHTGLTRR